MAQFELKKYFDVIIYGIDFSFTNASLIMVLVAIFLPIILGICVRMSSGGLSKSQIFVEMIYDFCKRTVIDGIGVNGEKYLTFMTALILYICTLNLLGMVFFSTTSHFSITIPLGFLVFFTCLITSLLIHKHKFFSIFIPSGIPFMLKPLMLVIELFSYLIRPFSLGLRLGANLIAGHVMLAVVGGLIHISGNFWLLPMIAVVAIAIFESAIAMFQGYIFVILSSTYISSALDEHH